MYFQIVQVFAEEDHLKPIIHGGRYPTQQRAENAARRLRKTVIGKPHQLAIYNIQRHDDPTGDGTPSYVLDRVIFPITEATSGGFPI